jgi:hypothetical protein
MIVMVVRMAAAVLAMAKDQGFDHHGNRLGIRKLLAYIDKIEILKVDPVDRYDSGAGYELALDDVAHQLSDIGVKDQH